MDEADRLSVTDSEIEWGILGDCGCSGAHVRYAQMLLSYLYRPKVARRSPEVGQTAPRGFFLPPMRLEAGKQWPREMCQAAPRGGFLPLWRLMSIKSLPSDRRNGPWGTFLSPQNVEGQENQESSEPQELAKKRFGERSCRRRAPCLARRHP